MAKKNANKQLFDKLPPNAVDLESALLGIILLDGDAIDEVMEVISDPDAFYDDKNKIIYRTMLELAKSNSPVDMMSVFTKLQDKGLLDEVGGAAYLTSLQNKVSTTAHTEFYSYVVLQKYMQRKLIKAANEILERAYDEEADVGSLLDESEKLLFEVSEGQLKQKTDPINLIMTQVIKDIEFAANHKTELLGVPSGYFELDKITNGWQNGNLIIIAARPSMGKTAFALNIMRNAAVDYGMAAAIFSLEMEKKELVRRLIASETKINSRKLMNGELSESEWKRLNEQIERLNKAPIYINDSGISVFELRAIARRLKKKYDIKLLVVDYLQLMNADNVKKNTNREQEVSIISRSLKSLAKELNIPIIALSQLNRELEKRSDKHKRPMLSDLRESGAIEQDADMVIFIHRPERLGITHDEEGQPTEGVAEIIIAKNRNGVTDTVKLRFIGDYTLFTNWDDDEGMFDEPNFENGGSIILSSKVNEEPDIPDLSPEDLNINDGLGGNNDDGAPF